MDGEELLNLQLKGLFGKSCPSLDIYFTEKID